MAKVGYIYQAVEGESLEAAKEWMEEYGCVKILTDIPRNEKLRPKWKELIEVLSRGDELVLAKFSNAIRTTESLSHLIEYCRVKVVRIISIGDKIDTRGVLFPRTTANDVLNIVGSLPEESLAIRQQAAHINIIKRVALARVARVVSKTEREMMIVNMYHSNHTIADIWKASGFASRASVFRILNKHGVALNRGKYSGPIGPRKKKEE